MVVVSEEHTKYIHSACASCYRFHRVAFSSSKPRPRLVGRWNAHVHSTRILTSDRAVGPLGMYILREVEISVEEHGGNRYIRHQRKM